MMKRILAAIGNVLSIALSIVSIPVALFMSFVFMALPIVFVLWILGVWPVDDDTHESIVQSTPSWIQEDYLLTPTECYSVTASYLLDSAIMSMCRTCPDIPPTGFCDEFESVYYDSRMFWTQGCPGVVLQPTREDIDWQCDWIEEDLGGESIACGDQMVIDRFIDWSLFYCPQHD